MNNKINDSAPFLSGFIAIAGPPNVGKSTLLNRLLGEKVSIVSPKPQTTRNRIMGIYHGKDFQMVFMDTPGIHKTSTPLHKSMVLSAQEAFFEVDIIMVVIEMPRPDDPEISLLLESLKKVVKPVILVINKIDRGSRSLLLPLLESFGKLYPFETIIPISALKGDGIDILIDELKKRLKPGPEFFPKDMTTDQSELFLVSEIIREKIYFHTRREVPYSSAVTVEKIEKVENKDLISISGIIHVESESQKAIIIGKNGSKIKEIGKSARMDLEKLFHSRIYLELFTRVEKDWSRDTKTLRKLGY